MTVLRILTGWCIGVWLAVAAVAADAQPACGVAFYDVDCLYDTLPSPFRNDLRYLPQGEMRWSSQRYRLKIERIAAVIDSLALPLVALYGVENEAVVRDLAAACTEDYVYEFRTTDSYNGLDNALLYHGDRFFPKRIDAGHFWMEVAGELRGFGPVCLLLSSSDRYIYYKIAEHRQRHPDERLVVLGRTAEVDAGLYGLVEALAAAKRAGRGSRRVGGKWTMRSNILLDTALCSCRADVYAQRWLFDESGASPWATYTRRRYDGGYGANLPVFCYFR